MKYFYQLRNGAIVSSNKNYILYANIRCESQTDSTCQLQLSTEPIKYINSFSFEKPELVLSWTE